MNERLTLGKINKVGTFRTGKIAGVPKSLNCRYTQKFKVVYNKLHSSHLSIVFVYVMFMVSFNCFCKSKLLLGYKKVKYVSDYVH